MPRDKKKAIPSPSLDARKHTSSESNPAHSDKNRFLSIVPILGVILATTGVGLLLFSFMPSIILASTVTGLAALLGLLVLITSYAKNSWLGDPHSTIINKLIDIQASVNEVSEEVFNNTHDLDRVNNRLDELIIFVEQKWNKKILRNKLKKSCEETQAMLDQMDDKTNSSEKPKRWGFFSKPAKNTISHVQDEEASSFDEEELANEKKRVSDLNGVYSRSSLKII